MYTCPPSQVSSLLDPAGIWIRNYSPAFPDLFVHHRVKGNVNHVLGGLKEAI
jgi:hypothetical protein